MVATGAEGGAGSAPRAPAIPWRFATVLGTTRETARAVTLHLRVPDRARHLAGQHYVVRLTAPDGYSAARSYSVASPPDDGDGDGLDLTVERLDDGEVSTFLQDSLEPGDELEVRGPIGRWFVWKGETPAVLIGGGSGLVPLMAMLRMARRTGRPDLVRLVVSVRSPADLYYADELPGPETTVVYTRAAPPAGRAPAPGAPAPRPVGRLTVDDLAPVLLDDAMVYICGSTGFADAASDLCVELGVPAERIRVERFGPS